MFVQPLRPTPDGRLSPVLRPAVEPKVAVLLNANARKVTQRVIRSLSHVVAEEDLFISRSQLDARRIVQTVLERRYPTVFLGGGDGTFMGFVNEFYNQLEHRGRYQFHRPPRFGVLKLGTGNGLASVVNASSPKSDGFLDDVLRARAGEVPGYRKLDLLSVEGKRAPFAGLGVDGKVLNDYIWVKQNLGKGMLKRLMTGPGGYFSAVALKTVPHFLTHSSWVECEVVNGPEAFAYRLGPDGQPVGQPIEPGAEMFKGRLLMASASTVPFYGFEFRMFPYAGRRRGMMQLRLAAVTTSTVLGNLPSLWSGRYSGAGVTDFHAQNVTVRFERPMAFQIGGDAEGYRQEVTFGMNPEPIEVLDFNGSVN